MQTIFHKLILASVAMAAVAVATNPAMAASTVKVPFAFNYAGKICPAGEYTVARDITGNSITLKSPDPSKTFKMMVGPGNSAAANSVVMRFAEEGDTHTLRSIQYESQTTPQLDKKTRVSQHNRVQDYRGQ